MKKLLTLCLASTVAIAAYADTFTFVPNDPDMDDLDHHYAYTWGVSWNLPADSQITGASLTFNKIWDWKFGESDSLFVRLLDDTSKGIKKYVDNTNDNVQQDYFAGKGTELFRWEDPLGGKASNAHTFTYNFSAEEVAALIAYVGNGHGYNKADFGISFDPDCHYFNEGITLTVTTSRVPDGGVTMMLLGLGLLALSGLRRLLS